MWLKTLNDAASHVSADIDAFLVDLEKHPDIREKFCDDLYKQNLYAALCNNLWSKGAHRFNMSWRYAAEVVSAIEQLSGTYIDWYCSGIGAIHEGYVQEGTITHELLEDMLSIGWSPLPI